ncbi:MAG TPA: hypothetical protein VG895_03250 [Patescibacteria group bacterium]|nr:hypothetical protein [Patescibacteria group bacterium]
MKRSVLVLLFLIFIFGYFLRIMFLHNNILTFGYDQARDAVNALEIAHGHLKIFGPPASQPGLFHGVFYYYVLAPFYLIGRGSPIVAAYGIALINSLTILIVFYLTFLMTKNIKTSLIAGFLYAISFEATQYATWLSNPTLGIVTVPLMYLGLWEWINRKEKYWLIIAALGLGLSIQSEIFLAYHIVPLVIWLYIGRKNVTRKQLMTFGGVLILTLLTMFLAQLKFGIVPTINAVKSLANGDNGNLAYEKSIGDYLILYLNQTGRIFSFNSYPGNVGWSFVLVIAMAITGIIKHDRKILFLDTWLFSHLSVVTVGGTSTPFLMVGIGPAVSILIASFIGTWINKKYYILAFAVLIILIYGNISMTISQNKNAATLFSIQKDMVLNKEISAVDYTYSNANGKPFSVNTLTSPLWVNIVWSYLYKWYGQDKYNYIPTWHGRGQEGQVIALNDDNNKWNLGFSIIEPQDGIPPQYLPEFMGQENSYSKIVGEKSFGAILVQERDKQNLKILP